MPQSVQVPSQIPFLLNISHRQNIILKIFVPNRLLTGVSKALYQNINKLIKIAKFFLTKKYCGPGSSVGIATGYGLDVSGSSPGGERFFAPVQTDFGP